MNQLNSYRDLSIYLLMALGGLRVGEVCKIEMHDLKLDQDYILLRDTKNRKDWKVFVNQDIKNSLALYIINERQPTKKTELFLTIRNSKMTNRLIEKIINDAGKKANVEVYPHLLRHTCATQMRINGADIDTIKNQLRHLDYKSTERYVHAIDEVQKKNYLRYCPKIE